MPHGLDHIVHAVRDLDAAAEFYSSAGFTVGARNRHAWGTHNRIVQLKNCYIEILEVAEPEKIVPHGARSFSFGAFNRDFLASCEGFSMLILNSSNAVEDARSFEAAGIGGFKVFDFAREGAKPDGTPVKLAFSLAFARDPASPNLRFGQLVLQNGRVTYTDNFIKPNFTANLVAITGTIGAFGTHSTTPAPVDVAAKLSANGPVSIKGVVNPLIAKPSLDLIASAHDVELPNISPYSFSGSVMPSV